MLTLMDLALALSLGSAGQRPPLCDCIFDKGEFVNDQEVTEYHARRLLVAPPRRARVRVDPLYRVARVVKGLVDYGFIVLYTLLAARLVLLLLPGGVGGILNRMLAPVTDPLVMPFDSWLPDPILLPDQLSLLSPILAATITAVVVHRLLHVGLRFLARPRLGSEAGPGVLVQRVYQRDERMADALR